MQPIELFKVIFLGIVEGITEWLPVSSTGHMLLVDEFLGLDIGPNAEVFSRIFIDVIQLGAILAVVVLYFGQLWPFKLPKNGEGFCGIFRPDVFSMWFKVIVACIPGFIATVLTKDIVDTYLNTPYTIAAALIIYGIAFIIIENFNKRRSPAVNEISELTYRHALLIGVFQVLSIIPGTSRSGSTIIGALLLGVSRKTAAEFTFFLAVPVMVGLSALETLSYALEYGFVPIELLMLLAGMLTAFVVSYFVIRFLMSYIRKHDFKVFGIYRIILGIAVILYFALR